ncbi:MAG: hypothetical protein NC418_08530 [Muribaculaceae bacterium]|nr:hypothetical protein [Muribaculaceae bacterium]
MKRAARLRDALSRLSFRTGVWVLAVCVLCYVISFAQMLLPVSAAAKTALWVVFFGLAKAAQYSAILILGTTGVARLRRFFKKESE